MTQLELQARLHTVRSQYRVSPWIQPREDEAPLLRSWQRCLDAGMREHERVSFEMVSRAWLAELDDVHGDLVRAARPETERLARAVNGTGAAVMLFNTRGVVIDRLCHEALTPPLLLTASRVGVNVAERCVGTTAPAIALAEGLPYLVGRDAHFFANTRPFFCVAAPIDNPQGERLAAVDITSYDSVPGFDVFSLVVDAAAAIENALFRPGPDALVVHFHPRAELLGTALEGLLLVDAAGRIVGANRMALRLLCMTRPQVQVLRLSDLFDRRATHLFGRAGCQADAVEVMTPGGLQVLARFEGPDGLAPRQVPGRCGSSLPVPLRPGGAEGAPAASPMSPGGAGSPGGAAGVGGAGALPVPLTPEAITPMRALEIETIRRTLDRLGGNVSAAARQLGISRNTIYRRLAEGSDTGPG